MTRKKRRGRPAWKPTKAERSKGKTLLGMGTSVATVAKILGIDPRTLKKHLGEEIATSRAEADAAVMAALYRSATDRDRPNVRAIRTWAEVRGLFPAAARKAEQSTAAEGKKVARKAAAHKVASSGRFAPGPPPRLVVDNTNTAPTAASDDEPAK